MDAGETYATRIALIVATVLISLVVSLTCTGWALAVASTRASLVVVDAGVVEMQGTSPTVHFTDDTGQGRELTLWSQHLKSGTSGQHLAVAFPAGQWTRAAPPPDPAPLYAAGFVPLLLGPALVLCDRRMRMRLAYAQSPINRQAVDVEVRLEKSGKNSTRWAMLAIGVGQTWPNAKLCIGASMSRLAEGRYAGEIAGDIRPGGIVVLWVNGKTVPISGTLRRA